MKKIKILHIIPDFGTGGAEKLVLDLLSNYDKSKFTMAVLSLYNKSDTIYEKQLEKIGVEVFYLGKKPGVDISMIYKIFKLFKKYKPNVIHTHRYVVRYTLIPSVLQCVPIRIHTVHNVAEKELDQIGIKIQNIAYRFFSYIPVAISKSVRKSITELYKINSDIPLINNGIDIQKYSFKGIKKDRDSINLIHIGRFSPQKNHDFLINVFSRVATEKSNVRLRLVGDGELRKQIEDKVILMGIVDRVEFLGIREDIPNLLAESDIFLMSSNWEGLPLTILEAMASGLPIIATEVGGIPDVAKHNSNAILVPRENKDLFYKAVVSLIDDINLRNSMSEKSFLLSREFDIRVAEKQYEELYVKKCEEMNLIE
ncbi:glycosyltransferase [Peribacillus sp. FSL E2-0218]|uniref:glycosyltransferase n=1 Tax=Peribacillus sp. FSL E2-0218 TaxID=2921364 RepID=UPI0030EBC39F